MKPLPALLAIAVTIALPATATAQSRLAPLPGTPAGTAAPASAARGTIPGQVIVQFKRGVSASARGGARRAADVGVVKATPQGAQQLLEVQPGQTVADAIRELERDPRVAYAQPNFVYHATSTVPNDRWFGQLWGMRNTGQAVHGVPGVGGTAGDDIDATLAWDRTTGSKNVVVAVVDTGVAYDHPDLDGNIWQNPDDPPGGGDQDGNGFGDDFRGHDFVDDDNDPRDLNDHGTHVSGTIGAEGNNGIGVAGVNWAVSIMPVRVLDASGNGSSFDVASGFDYAGDEGARVVNASLGGTFTGGSADQMTRQAILDHPNTLYVVAAGNDGTNNDFFPKSPCNIDVPNIVCVAATTQNDGLAGFSNFGATSVDMGAPGTNVLSTVTSHEFGDDFEDGLGKWSVQSPWNVTGSAAAAGFSSVTDSPGGNYAPNTNALLSASFAPLPSGCQLSFQFRLDTELGADGYFIETSTNNTTFPVLTSNSGSTGGSFASDSRTLPTGTRTVRFRFFSDSDGIVGDGVYLDDVKIGCLDTTYDLPPTELSFFNGTSMATPHVAGAAALALSLKPSATAADLKSALMSSGDPVQSLEGFTVSGRRLNVFNLLNTISPPPATTPPSGTPPPPPGGPIGGGPVTATLATAKISGCKQTGSGRNVRVQCTLGNGAAVTTASMTLKKGRRTIAKATVKPRNGKLSLKLKRKLSKGRYKLTIVLRDSAGHKRTLSRTIRR